MPGIKSDDTRVISRRNVLRAGAALGATAAAGSLLAACGAQSPSSVASPLGSSGAAASPGGNAGAAELDVWSQDWEPLNKFLDNVKQMVESEHTNVKVNVNVMAGPQLGARILPSLAAGTEADVMFAYRGWIAGVNPKAFFPFVPEVMSMEDAASRWYPKALDQNTEAGVTYALPFLEGWDGSVWTYNLDILEKEGIDPASIKTWDEFVEAGKKLTKREGDKIVRSGIGLRMFVNAWMSGLYQLGGVPFDPATGKWNLTSDASIKALQNLDDLYKVHRVDDVSLEYGNSQNFEAGLSVFSNEGPWIVGGFKTPIRTGLLPAPTMGTAQAIWTAGVASLVFSRRLYDDAGKREAALAFANAVSDADVVGEFADSYPGGFAMSEVSKDPDIQANRKFGPFQKLYDEQVWPNMVTTPTHVSGWRDDPAVPTILRVLHDNEPIEVVLKELEDTSNVLERDARDRLQID